ncbi:MAG: tetratricopeptide repeat protein [Paludibacteraceae bacterium]|nr:tetratricopeptide repeat protein [Paludibacteraceae bacterium]
MKRISILLIIALSVATGAASAQTTLDEANQLYADGNYTDAAAAYEYMLQDTPSAELYYNLGNAYFRQNELAKAILNYERALRLKPYNKDARYNLRFAQSRIIDNIEEKDAFFISQWVTSLRNLLNESTWSLISICLFLLTIAGAFAFAFSRNTALRKTGFHTAWIALVLSVCTMCFSASLHHRDKARAEAIVMQGIVNAKASPDKSGTDLFTLHEGTKVKIRSTLSDWAEITVGDNRGWIRANTIERI